MPIISCPNREALTAFALGKLPPDEIETVTEDMEHCPTCESLLATIDAEGQ